MRKKKLGNLIVLQDCNTCQKKLCCTVPGCGRQICSIAEVDMGCLVGMHYRYEDNIYCETCYRTGGYINNKNEE